MSDGRTRCAWREEGVHIPTRDGTRLSAILARPYGEEQCRRRAIVMIHGFAAEKTEAGLFSGALSYFVRHGHWVVLYDWRGLGESEGDFADSDLKMHAGDFLDVVTWVSGRANVAVDRVVAVGFSLGATVIALALESRGLALGGIALLSPALRPKRDMYPRYSTDELKAELNRQGFIWKNDIKVGARFLQSLGSADVSPFWKKCRTPLIVSHGTNDSRIPYAGTVSIVRCGRLGKDVRFERFSGASHSFRPEDRHRPKLYELLCHWIERLDARGGGCQ